MLLVSRSLVAFRILISIILLFNFQNQVLRHNKIIISVQILLACFITLNSFSQQLQKEIKPEQYRAVNWTMEDGLSAAGIHTMIKDAEGFLWVGSDGGGFCRFDGASFKELSSRSK